MRQRPKPPTFDFLLDAIAAARSAADLAPLLTLAQTYIAGEQREALEAAVAKRQGEFADGDALSG
jgi:hypothetical protein